MDAPLEIGPRPRLGARGAGNLAHAEPVSPREEKGLVHAGTNGGAAGALRISYRRRSGTAGPGRRVPSRAGRHNRSAAARTGVPKSDPHRPSWARALHCRTDTEPHWGSAVGQRMAHTYP